MDTDIITYPTQETISVCIRKNSSNTKETLNTHNSCHKEYSALKKERKKKKKEEEKNLKKLQSEVEDLGRSLK